MPVYRITIVKTSPQNERFTNVYYVETIALSDARAFGISIADLEAPLFGDDVDFINVHTQHVGGSEFANDPLSFSGTLSTSNPISSAIVSKVVWGVAGAHNHYKLFRFQGNSSILDGLNLSTGYQLLLATYVTEINDAFLGILCTRSGVQLEAAVAVAQYTIQQTSKKWYNRTEE